MIAPSSWRDLERHNNLFLHLARDGFSESAPTAKVVEWKPHRFCMPVSMATVVEMMKKKSKSRNKFKENQKLSVKISYKEKWKKETAKRKIVQRVSHSERRNAYIPQTSHSPRICRTVPRVIKWPSTIALARSRCKWYIRQMFGGIAEFF